MSAPPIRIESKAWTDHRYAALALRLGLASPRFALVLVADLWCWQTEHYTDEQPTYSVPRAVIEGALGNLQGPEFLVAADLAVIEPDGRYRIRGGRDDKGASRIDWLWREREQRKSAGRASADRRKQAGDPRGKHGTFGDLPIAPPTGDQRATNDAPTGDQRQPNGAPSSLVSGLCSPEISDSLSSPAREEARPAPAPAYAPTARHVALAVELLNAARLEFDPTARAVATDPAFEHGLAGHLRPLPEADREPAIRHGVAAIAEAVRVGDETIGALRPGELAGPRSWAKWQAAPLKRVARGRDGPAGRTSTAKPLRGAAAAFANLDPEEP